MQTKSDGNPDSHFFSPRSVRRWSFAVTVGLGLAWVTTVAAESYQWTDDHGILHLGNDAAEVPETARQRLTVYRAAPSTPLSAPLRALQSPRRMYPEQSQGAFAQKVALDLGLIGQAEEDALGPLSGAGIQPAGDWSVTDPLTLTAVDEVVAAARRAAASRRLALSAEGAEAVVRHAAKAFLVAPAAAPAPVSPVEGEQGESPVPEEDPPVIISQPPPVIIDQPPVIIAGPPQVLPFPGLRGIRPWQLLAQPPGAPRGWVHEMRKRRAELTQPAQAPAGRPAHTPSGPSHPTVGSGHPAEPSHHPSGQNHRG